MRLILPHHVVFLLQQKTANLLNVSNRRWIKNIKDSDLKVSKMPNLEFALNSLNSLVLVIGVLIGSIVALFLSLSKALKTLRKFRNQLFNYKLIIGTVGNVEIPKCLRMCPDVTDFKSALLSEKRVVVMHCRTLSYALRHCHYVMTNADYYDPKIHHDSDVVFWDAIAND